MPPVGTANRQQQQINDFYRFEIEAFLEKLGKKRIVLNALASGLSRGHETIPCRLLEP